MRARTLTTGSGVHQRAAPRSPRRRGRSPAARGPTASGRGARAPPSSRRGDSAAARASCATRLRRTARSCSAHRPVVALRGVEVRERPLRRRVRPRPATTGSTCVPRHAAAAHPGVDRRDARGRRRRARQRVDVLDAREDRRELRRARSSASSAPCTGVKTITGRVIPAARSAAPSSTVATPKPQGSSRSSARATGTRAEPVGIRLDHGEERRAPRRHGGSIAQQRAEVDLDPGACQVRMH